jgi:hypothetical protein
VRAIGSKRKRSDAKGQVAGEGREVLPPGCAGDKNDKGGLLIDFSLPEKPLDS